MPSNVEAASHFFRIDSKGKRKQWLITVIQRDGNVVDGWLSDARPYDARGGTQERGASTLVTIVWKKKKMRGRSMVLKCGSGKHRLEKQKRAINLVRFRMCGVKKTTSIV